MSSKRRPQPQKKKQSSLPLVIILGVLVVAVLAGVLLVSRDKSEGRQGKAPKQSDADLLENAHPGAQPPHTKGPENAAIQIEEFGDYECPACGRVFHYLKKIEAERGANFRLTFRQNPLQMHRFASIAARAAEAAGMQDKFWEMHDALYEHQEEWSKKEVADPRPFFASYAQAIGLDVGRFTADMNSQAVSTRIVADLRRARQLYITATPTLYLNKHQLDGETTMDEDQLRGQIEAAAAAAPAQ